MPPRRVLKLDRDGRNRAANQKPSSSSLQARPHAVESNATVENCITMIKSGNRKDSDDLQRGSLAAVGQVEEAESLAASPSSSIAGNKMYAQRRSVLGAPNSDQCLPDYSWANFTFTHCDILPLFSISSFFLFGFFFLLKSSMVFCFILDLA